MHWLGSFSLLVLLAAVDAGIFKCPTNAITSLPTNGVIPAGATDRTQVPGYTNCTVTFQIPDGYAVKLLITSSGIEGLDSVIVIDTVGMKQQTPPSVVNYVMWFASGTAYLNIQSPTGSLYFFATYQYVSLSTFAKKQTYTGSYFSAQLAPNTVYTMSTIANDQVAVTVAKPNTQKVDTIAQMIYVYDGDNILKSRMIGRLSDLAKTKDRIYSSGKSVSFVCFYDQGSVKSVSYILGNDKSMVSSLSSYSAVTVSQGNQFRGSMKVIGQTTVGSATTFICVDCSVMYFNQLKFDNTGASTTGSIILQGLTPTQRMPNTIRYDAQFYTSAQMPQIIPTRMFTMYVRSTSVSVTISTNALSWYTPADKRTGFILSPNQWDPAQPSTFDYTFRNDSQLFTYTVGFTHMSYGTVSDNLSLQIGPTNGNPTINNNYPETSTSNKQVSSVGNYMKVALINGSPATAVSLTFSMDVYKAASGSSFILSCLLVILIYIG